MNGVFLDTVGLIAVWDRADQWHAAAVGAWAGIMASGCALFTTPFIIAECANAAARRPYRSAVERLRLRFTAHQGLIQPTPQEWESACVAYAAGHIGAPGRVDEISFTVMRRLGLQRAFTNDRHFANTGFEALF